MGKLHIFWRVIKAEREKLRRSSTLRVVWVLPLLFILMEFFFFQFKLIGLKTITEEIRQLADTTQISMTGALWGGFFYPLLIALIPSLLFNAEHRNKTWRHLGAMPVSKASIFFVKAAWVIFLSAISLTLVWLLLWAEHSLMQVVAPELHIKFHGSTLAALLGWLWLGSLPVASIYLWVSNRINSLAVPVMLTVVGILLSSYSTGQQMDDPWKRDFIPWITPTICVRQVLVEASAEKEANPMGALFIEEPDIIRLPSGKKVRTWQNIPDEILFPPEPPTPRSALAAFSLVAGALLMVLGGVDAGRWKR